MNGRFIDVTLDDPYSNLAAEEAVFRLIRTPSLRIWENQRSVVIGRAQLAAVETDVEYCATHGIPIVRRFTAGGAVYNGPGNLNWTFFAPSRSEHRRIRYSSDARKVFVLFGSIVVEALASCSVECRFVPPNRIETSLGKVSGMAAYLSRDGLICHGTLLLNADLMEVVRVSRPSELAVDRKYSRSTFSKVANVNLSRDSFVRSILGAAGLEASPQAEAATALFSLAIGHNGLPPNARTSGVGVLSFADDDALAVHELARTVARRSVVLALPDRATQARYPSSSEARPPSVAELRRALAELGADIARATRAGDEVTVWFFYSGHGWLDDDGRANLTLADGALSQDMLYNEVLPALPGRTVHLMIDACHAEALIRPRDVTAETVEISASEVASASLRSRLAQLPNVGAIMASASNTQAHEWDDYQTGVFTHELLSGLRGGADVNGDGRVEYSEIAAFLAAANREVTDPRARLTTLVAAPKLYPRVAIVDTRGARNLARLQGQVHHLGHFQIDDQRGNRLVDLRAESGFVIDVVVPAGEPILLSNESGEATIVASADSPTNLEELVLEKGRARPRSAVAESMRRGLFAAEFGPSYYGGFVDSSDTHMVPVELSPAGVRVAVGHPPRSGQHHAAWSAFAVAGASVAVSGVFAVLAGRAYADFQDTNLERPSIDARDRYERYGILALSAAAAGVLSGALGYWLWNRDNAGSANRR